MEERSHIGSRVCIWRRYQRMAKASTSQFVGDLHQRILMSVAVSARIAILSVAKAIVENATRARREVPFDSRRENGFADAARRCQCGLQRGHGATKCWLLHHPAHGRADRIGLQGMLGQKQRHAGIERPHRHVLLVGKERDADDRHPAPNRLAHAIDAAMVNEGTHRRMAQHRDLRLHPGLDPQPGRGAARDVDGFAAQHPQDAKRGIVEAMCQRRDEARGGHRERSQIDEHDRLALRVPAVEIGIEFIQEDDYFVFGAILKSNTARALRRTSLTSEQQGRIRERLVGMMLSGQVPREWREYKRLLRHVGLGSQWPALEKGVDREKEYVMRYYNYLDRFARSS